MSPNIVPAGVFDVSGNEKDSIVITGWVVDRVLDPAKVERAWATVVQTWPLLGARLRKNKNTSAWEYHLYSSFSPSRHRYGFKHTHKDGPIDDHYAYARPTDSMTLTVKDNNDALFSDGGPRSVTQLMSEDIPITFLQVTTFTDASIIGLTTPHVLCDGHGNKEIGIALARILKGETVAPLPEGDPLAKYAETGKTSSLESPPSWRVFGLIDSAKFFATLAWDFAVNRDIENRELFVPTAEAERIKQQAMDDLRKEHGDSEDIWISTSDALVAFCLQNIHGPTTSTTPLNVLYSANLRRYLSDVLPRPYLHNGACTVITPTLPLSAISSMSLGALALHIRRTVSEQTARPAVEHWLRWRLANAGRLTLFFEPTGAWNGFTNWRDMKLMEIDFSGALPDNEEGTAKCVYLWGMSFQPFPVRNFMGLVADDPRGGIWIGGFLSKRVWEREDGFGRFIRRGSRLTTS
ncbi:hypothetical protein EXIGLDRAFT_840716 [Exidia glandulosa HHB12029]|uniref:Uncharacterized protein n=1 Tax=Exidia glandulosa HHB12029 TaxID=1314781 RepID=A0A165EBH0_EXIGL|nr:hypothetical protein EXIGLDRAFT_840716 [Exidia glandulosa HHB12029]